VSLLGLVLDVLPLGLLALDVLLLGVALELLLVLGVELLELDDGPLVDAPA